MKAKFIYILATVLSLCFVGCKDDNTVKINLSQPNITEIPSEGGSYDIKVTATDTWVVKDKDRSWMNIAKYTKGNEQYLKVEVASNLSESARVGKIELYSRNSRVDINIQQTGKPTGQELKYRLPLVFHVMYFNESDKNQNIPQDKLYEVLQKVNKIYADNGINLEFYLAAIDPSGNVMAESGIERVKWVSNTINPIEVMSHEDNEYLHLLWDPNKYINVMLYPFSIPNILGIATFPLTPEQYPLEGLDGVPFADLKVSDLKHLRGVSINSSWFKEDVKDPFNNYVKKDLLDRQVNIATTLAHELGHYFGLRHVFSEGPEGSCVDTDYCEDTPSYDKARTYDYFVAEMAADARYNPNFKNEFKWESLFHRSTCDGKVFEARNIMDYAYCYMDTFSAQQKARMRHVLTHSPFVPGPKHSSLSTLRNVNLGPVKIPNNIVICRAHASHPLPR